MRPITTLFILASLALAGCVDHDASAFFISGDVAPQSGGMSGCMLDPGNPLVSRGVFNVDSAFGYFVFPLYNNQLRNRGSDAPLRSDPNGVHVTSAEIELRDAAGNSIDFGSAPNPFSVPLADYVPSTDDAKTPAQSVGNILVVPPAYAGILSGMFGDATVVVASVTVFGETTGGVDVESDEWLWPIDVCRGDCLFECLAPDASAESDCCTPGQDFTCQVACE